MEKQGVKVIMTREDENGIADSKAEDMKERVAIINREKPCLLYTSLIIVIVTVIKI